MGSTYEPFHLDYERGVGLKLPDASLPDGVDASRLHARWDLLQQLGGPQFEPSAGGPYSRMTSHYQLAHTLIASRESLAALDVGRETDKARDAYGRHRFGQCCLIACRLVEAGIPFVQVNWSTHVEGPEDAGDGGWDMHDRYSPDGSRVLFAAITLSGTQGNLDLAAINVDGTGLKTIVGDGSKLAHQDWPSWSPDGKRFAFSSTHEGNQEIYTAAVDGTDVLRLTQSPGLDAHPSWSPDGRTVAFATDRWGGLELAAVGRDGTGLIRLTNSHGLDDYPVYSPDGSRLAFVSNRDGQFEIYVSAADGSAAFNLSRHPQRDTYPTWTPDGRALTFVSDRDGGLDLYTQVVRP